MGRSFQIQGFMGPLLFKLLAEGVALLSRQIGCGWTSGFGRALERGLEGRQSQWTESIAVGRPQYLDALTVGSRSQRAGQAAGGRGLPVERDGKGFSEAFGERTGCSKPRKHVLLGSISSCPNGLAWSDPDPP